MPLRVLMRPRSRRFFLREATSQTHAMLETAVGALVSLEAYRRYVGGMHAFRAPIEQAWASWRWPEGFGAWRPIGIAPLLAEDLRDLQTANAPREARTSCCPAVSNDVSELVGTLYVLEGSALGARILY